MPLQVFPAVGYCPWQFHDGLTFGIVQLGPKEVCQTGLGCATLGFGCITAAREGQGPSFVGWGGVCVVTYTLHVCLRPERGGSQARSLYANPPSGF